MLAIYFLLSIHFELFLTNIITCQRIAWLKMEDFNDLTLFTIIFEIFFQKSSSHNS